MSIHHCPNCLVSREFLNTDEGYLVCEVCNYRLEKAA